MTVGYQPFSLPFSGAFYDSVVLAADSNSDYASLIVSAPLIDADLSGSSFSNYLTAGGSYLSPTRYADNQVAALWTGATLTAEPLDPIKL